MISDTKPTETEAARSARICAALAGLRGARIALIAPGGGVSDERIDAVLALLAQAGIVALPGAHIRDHHRYLAGTRDARLADLHEAFETPDIDAVWCLRGGYGSAHLISHIDWTRIPRDVTLIGHSDITALANAFTANGRSALHGPMATDLLQAVADEETRAEHSRSIASIADRLQGQPLDLSITHHAGPGQAGTACLWGGNLTVLASVVDMGHAPPGDAPILLLLEDVGEAGFRLERCFHQVTRAPWFARVRGVAIGDFHRCALEQAGLSLIDILGEHIDLEQVDLFTGLAMGHGARNQSWRPGVHIVYAPETPDQNNSRWRIRPA